MSAEITRLTDHQACRASLPERLAGPETNIAPERAAAAEEVAHAAYHLISQWGAWGLLQAGAIAAERPQKDRQEHFWAAGAADVLNNDPVSAALSYTALERLDEAMDRWLKQAHEHPAGS